MRSLELALAGWGGAGPETCRVFRPERLRELTELVETHRADGQSLLARGLGRSYGDAAVNGGGSLALMERFDRLIDFDPERGILEAEAGLSLSDALRFLVPKGFWLPVVPGTRHVTLGGAVGNDIHGKNHHRDGSFVDAVLDFRLRTADGSVVRCSREENIDLFWATAGGLGLTGIIESLRVRCIPIETSLLLGRSIATNSLEDTLEKLAQHEASARYAVTWLDLNGRNPGRGVVLLADHAPLSALTERQKQKPREYVPRSRSFPWLPPFPFRRSTVGAFNTLYRWAKSTSRPKTLSLDEYFFPLDQIDRWNRLYGKGGFSQFQCVLPFEAAKEGYGELLKKIQSLSLVVPLAVMKSFGKASGGWLSFPRPGITLSIDTPFRGPKTTTALRELAAMAGHFGGRVYLAKDSVIGPIEFFSMYPEAAHYRTKLREWDEHRVFQSSAGRRIGLFEGDVA